MYADAYDTLIARTYDAVYAALRDPSGDVAFYRGLAVASGGAVLELGCGTGRTLLPIAAAGVPCVGLDASAAMLAVLQEKAPNVEAIQGDMRSFDLGRRFALVTIPFRAFSHCLTVDDQLSCLASARRHLAPGAALALDVFDPMLEVVALGAVPERLGAEFTYEGHRMRRWEATVFDRTRQTLAVTFRFEGGPPAVTGTTTVTLRWFYRYELEHLLARAGFGEIDVFGGFDCRRWSAGCETVIVAR